MASRSDDFNRTAVPPGVPSDGGSAWVVDAGTWGCGFDGTSGRFVGYADDTGATDMVMSLDCGTADQTTSALLVQQPGNSGVTCRVTDASNYYVWLVLLGGTTRLYKVVAGTFTSLGDGSLTAGAGDTLVLAVSGTSLVGKVNGATAISVTDSAITTGNRGGLFASGGGFAYFDTFALTVAGGGATPRSLFRQANLALGAGGSFYSNPLT